MFSNTLSFLSSRSVNDQVSHPYKTTGKNLVLYILTFKFLVSKPGRQKILHQMIASTSLPQSAPNFFRNRILGVVNNSQLILAVIDLEGLTAVSRGIYLTLAFP